MIKTLIITSNKNLLNISNLNLKLKKDIKVY